MATLTKRQMGSCGIEVSVLGLGTVKLGRDQEVKYPSGFTIPNDNEVRNLLTLAKNLGINFIDTAPAYGNSEERLGQLMTNPNDWVIMTKVGEIFENGQSSFDFSAEHTRMSVERSLKRLKRESLDLVLVHSNGDDMNIINNEGALEELDRLKEKGLIQSYGMSTKTVEGGMWIVENTDVVMATLNLSDDHDLPVIHGNHVQLEQMLINLINNSRDALVKNGNVRLQVRRKLQDPTIGILIRVEDDGPGFPEAILPKIFFPFVTTKQPGSGTGLGLAIVSQIVSQHKGTVRAGRSTWGGALVEILGGGMTLAAADGFRLSVRKAELKNGMDRSVKAIIPARALSELARIAVDDEDSVSVKRPLTVRHLAPRTTYPWSHLRSGPAQSPPGPTSARHFHSQT